MNCDQAFDCLTDSRRRHSAELKRHLAGCPRCRQMHDTLEPALELFDGVVEEPDLSRLVRDPRPMVSTESRQLAEQAAARLVTAGGPRPRRGNWTGFVRYAAVFVCGALVVLVLGTAQQRFGGDLPQAPTNCRFWSESTENLRGLSVETAIARCGNCHHEPAVVPPRDSPRGDGRDDALRVLKFPEIGRLHAAGSESLALFQPRHVSRPHRAARDEGLHRIVLAAPRAAGRSSPSAVAGDDGRHSQSPDFDVVAGPASGIPVCERSPIGRTARGASDVPTPGRWPVRLISACDALVASRGHV